MRKIKKILPKKNGRAGGTISVRHKGGRQKRYLREIDFKRDKRDIVGRVLKIEYDPNRRADIALVLYEDGEKRYILAPTGLEIDQKIVASESAPHTVGNALPLVKIPVGSDMHNLEIKPGKGGQMVKTAGAVAIVHGKDEGYVLVKLPSGEIRKFENDAYATLGQVGNSELKSKIIGKAGRKRRMGIRPSVRGTAMHPGQHPHGGGEGRSGVGMKHPKTVYGKSAVGRTRKKGKYSNRLIVERRKPGKHQRIIKL